MLEQIVEHQCPCDIVFGINRQFNEDPSPQKVNLTIGAYRDAQGQPYQLPVVIQAMQTCLHSNFEYPMLEGNREFNQLSAHLIFNEPSICSRIATVQVPSGTGALRSMCAFIVGSSKRPVTFYYPKQTWGNHMTIATHAGLSTKPYQYWYNGSFSYEMMIASLENAQSGDIILLQGCCHNPCGTDPTHEEWVQIAKYLQTRKLIPAFDLAYYGFGDGLDEDLWSTRYFAEHFEEMFVCQSYSKILGLYSERIGCLHVICPKKWTTVQVQEIIDRITVYTRALYGCSPKYFSEVISHILKTPELMSQLKSQTTAMRQRLISMRQLLRVKLEQLCPQREWSEITLGKGFFYLLPFNEEQLKTLLTHKVYLVPPGRLCICGLNEGNVDYVAEQIAQVIKTS